MHHLGWYASWSKPPKATASTSVARENILGGTVKSRNAPDFSRFETKRNEDDASMPDDADSVPPPPAAPTNESSGSRTDKRVDEDTAAGPLRTGDKDRAGSRRAPEMPSASEAKLATEPQQKASDSQAEQAQRPEPETAAGEVGQTPDASQKQAASYGWFGWWGNKAAPADPPVEAAPSPGEAKEEVVKPAEISGPAESAPSERVSPSEPPTVERAPEAPQATSWFGFWYGSPQPKAQPASAAEPDTTKERPAPPEAETSSKQGAVTRPTVPSGETPPLCNDERLKGSAVGASRASSKNPKLDEESKGKAEDVPKKDDSQPTSTPAQIPPPKAGSTWAFWSRQPSNSKGKPPPSESGEIAVIGERSEVQPTPMAERSISGATAREPKDEVLAEPPAGVLSWRRSKRIRPISMDLDAQRPRSADSTKSAPLERNSTPQPAQVGIEHELPPSKPPARADSKKKKPAVEGEPTTTKEPPNVLLPSFSSTYQMKENPSILRQITNLLLRTSQPPPNHVFRVKDPPRIRKAVAIGVHGFFPASYLRPMIGQPTGTSLRFASLCADAIRKWADGHGCADCEIEKVALEGEGRINDRVANLWKLLLNWTEHIRQADLVVIACHSQGVPVSIMLLEKLIDLGVLADTRIGVCAMAGVALGPFPDYKSSILMGSAAELWEFGDPQSSNSKRFEACLKCVVDFGARITFVGSIDDQLVPMESAVYSPANHPYIYRAVFIDGRVHAPDFISHLIGFALKLRNLGISDHGLIRELSVALAGSLYSGEGHSRLYFDAAVYDLAIMHALETTGTAQPTPCVIPKRETTPLASSNPYVLPWIMRGLLEEDFVKTQLSTETEELLRQFDDWKPTNKALKDVKYRLEVVRSKL
ncbi:hypothetical protein Trco_008266 [Trichoderma cornu-damae]|uniref:YMC020W-like alpha/beta hydrolase domain-containing protein n=1 Tax=Trichoderma cornu-damae TaxID=654480 RepID=A0A9P8QDY8_9HYPO|nr:hypothetical protein Trco_008266 [Trichoderma cornu-damae]